MYYVIASWLVVIQIEQVLFNMFLKTQYANSYSSVILIEVFINYVIASWLVFLLCSGDIHPSPGGLSSSS